MSAGNAGAAAQRNAKRQSIYFNEGVRANAYINTRARHPGGFWKFLSVGCLPIGVKPRAWLCSLVGLEVQLPCQARLSLVDRGPDRVTMVRSNSIGAHSSTTDAASASVADPLPLCPWSKTTSRTPFTLVRHNWSEISGSRWSSGLVEDGAELILGLWQR